MRLHTKTALGALATAVAVTAFAPSASAELVCQSVGKDRLRSTVCAQVIVDESSASVWVGCSLLDDWAVCAIDPVTVPLPPPS